ncbi:MAG TPA: glycosyltransferase [Chitinophagaceae bacterium]
MKKILFISYDGLTDPLGQSQILTYIEGLAAGGYKFDILSFEKEDRLRAKGEEMQKYLDARGIGWHYFTFGKAGRLLSKAADLRKMKNNALALAKENKYDLIHCRSYQAAESALRIQSKMGTPYLFDMRGFWVDERVDGKAWDKSKLIYRLLYNYYKRLERKMLANATGVISLTEKAKQEMMSWNISQLKADNITVIPCSADEKHFTIVDNAKRLASRDKLGVPRDAYVLGYLGSIGSWYLLPEMLTFFKQLKQVKKNAVFLFITPSPANMVLEKAREMGLEEKDIYITSATRAEVPAMIHAFDCGISFIMPSYSKIASSPTKMGELLISGIPIVVNSGVGDVKEIMESYGTGVVLDDFSETSVERGVAALDGLQNVSPTSIRNKALEYYKITSAFDRYRQMYNRIWTTAKV